MLSSRDPFWTGSPFTTCKASSKNVGQATDCIRLSRLIPVDHGLESISNGVDRDDFYVLTGL
jgi:hypothetical protein